MTFRKKLNFKKSIIIFLLLTLFIFVSAISYVKAISENISNSIFRLHLVANSNSNEDQNLKFKIRDNLLLYMNTLCSSCSSKEEVIEIAKCYKEDFRQIAEKIIKENGFNYPVSVQINNSYFPTKIYGDISLPAGYYDCLKVNIGTAEGQNWWCVMFPPLCFIDVSSGIVPETSKQQMKENLDDEGYNLISKSNDDGINFKFKLIEIFQKFKLGKNN